MFYSVASPDWKPGQSLAPAGALLFRSRVEAESFAPEALVVVVSVRHDSSTRKVVSQGCGATVAGWSAQAVENRLGGITVFGVIPASLIRLMDVTETDRRAARTSSLLPGDFHGWDSLTMALLA